MKREDGVFRCKCLIYSSELPLSISNHVKVCNTLKETVNCSLNNNIMNNLQTHCIVDESTKVIICKEHKIALITKCIAERHILDKHHDINRKADYQWPAPFLSAKELSQLVKQPMEHMSLPLIKIQQG